ncbi:MAG TPA: 50S ribosomal protein L6 [Candidatus Sabulitectum sp.]|nr:50S ribosomal protein L6 [Candidatus Sabulitectum sp.]HPF31509.1 50S ribosomal protein L6 [Candidatus Sabulitectum sp.]HPJ27958.1 50S ribosomal protein L6 [Candidatus Sabulitectum sp.]HPR21761.1 50S ribosomal protein L6 [Candidatus Sabulitectum sp.]HRW78317.1 50S ribosomal protein L6 [Candidatus Sabulitectum sp.]
MSRIGRLPIPIQGVEVTMKDGLVSVKGKRGADSYPLPEGIVAEVRDGNLHLERQDDSTELRRLHGVTRAELNNRVVGVRDGHKKELIVEGKGYAAEIKGKALEMQIGFSHKVVADIPAGLQVVVKPGQNTFTLEITGNDRHLVGAFASTLYKLRKVEPYNLIGFRYSDQQVKRKAAKSVVS